MLILGAGPAGAAAALFAAKRGLSAAVIDRKKKPGAAGGVEWLNPAGETLLSDAGVRLAEARTGSIASVRFVNTAGGREANATIKPAAGLFDTGALAEAILAAARSAGAKALLGVEAARVELREDRAEVVAGDGRRVAGLVLLAADGCESLTARTCLRSREAPAGNAASVCCEFVAERPDKTSRPRESAAADLTLLLDTQDASRYGYVVRTNRGRMVGCVSTDSLPDARRRFAERLGQWRTLECLGKVQTPGAADVCIRPVPRGAALDRETHVAKRCLLIGDAGGFVSSVSHDGLYPAVWGARIAVDTVPAALQSRHTQDVLAEFDGRWRVEMGDYLRMPNTDLRFLLPLIFGNAVMAGKLAHAVVLGANI